MIDCIDCGAPVERMPGEKDVGERCAACWNYLVCGDDAEHFEMYGDDPYYASE